jgi:hypothetical protein
MTKANLSAVQKLEDEERLYLAGQIQALGKANKLLSRCIRLEKQINKLLAALQERAR